MATFRIDVTATDGVTPVATRIDGALGRIRSSVRDLSKDLTNIDDRSLNQLEGSLNSIAGTATKVTLALTAIGAAATYAAIQQESAFIGVRKTVEATEEGYTKIRKELIQLSETIPKQFTELAGIASIAGQLGVASENIVAFTETIARLADATNIVGEEGALQLAKFINITDATQDKVGELGSAIVSLGNNSATTERDILAMGSRLALASSEAGITAHEILALSTALSSAGIEAELGGTAMSMFISDMNTAILSGGDQLTKFAAVAGKTGEEFRESFGRSATGAIVEFLQGLKGISAAGGDVAATLSDLGANGSRQQRVLLALASQVDELSGKYLRLSEEAKTTDALLAESNQRYGTTESKLLQLSSAATNLAAAFGSNLKDALGSVAPQLTELIKGLREYIEENPGAVTAITALGTAATVAAGLLAGGAGLAASIIAVTKTVAGLKLALDILAASAGGKLLLAGGLGAGGLVAGLGAGAALGTSANINALEKDINAVSQRMAELVEVNAKLEAAGIPAIKDLDKAKKVAEDLGLASKSIEEIQLTLSGASGSFKITQEDLTGVTDATKALTAEQQSLLTSLRGLQAAPAALQKELQGLSGSITFLREQGASNSQIFELLGTKITGAADSAKKLGVAVPPNIRALADLGASATKAAKGAKDLDQSTGALRLSQQRITQELERLSKGHAALGETFVAQLETIEDLEEANKSYRRSLEENRFSLEAFQAIAGGSGVIFDEQARKAEALARELAELASTAPDVGAAFSGMAADLSGLIPELKEVETRFGTLPVLTDPAAEGLRDVRQTANALPPELRQVSTAIDDLAKSFVDFMLGGKSALDVLKDFGRTLLRIIAEGAIRRLINDLGNLLGGMGGFAGALGGILNPSGAGGIFTGRGGAGRTAGQAGAGGAAGMLGAAGVIGGLGIGGVLSGQAIGGPGGAFAGAGIALGGGFGLAASGALGGILGSGAFSTAMIGMLANPITAVIAGSLVGGGLLANAIHQSVVEKFGKEFARDFGGVQISKEFTKGLIASLGIDKRQLEPIRKDIASSPIALAGGYNFAREQGREAEFLASLEGVGTAWGERDFRGAFEFGVATNDFTALNAVFVDLFGSSTELVRLFGSELEPLLIDMAAAGVTPLVDSIAQLESQGMDMQAVFTQLRPVIQQQIQLSAELGLTLDPLIEKYRDMANEAGELSDRQLGLLFAFQSLQGAPDRVAKELETLADSIGFLRELGASDSDILTILGRDLAEIVEAADALGVALPESVQAMVDFAVASVEVATLAERMQAAFDGAFGSVAGSLEESSIRAAALAGEFMGLFEAITAGGVETEAALSQMASAGHVDKLISAFRELKLSGAEIPPQLENVLQLLLDIGLVRLDDLGFYVVAEAIAEAGEALEGFAALVADVTGGFIARAQRRADESAALFTGLVDNLVANGKSGEAAARQIADVLGGDLVRAFNDLTAVGLEVPEQLAKIINLLVNLGLIEIGDAGLAALVGQAQAAVRETTRVGDAARDAADAVEDANDRIAEAVRRAPDRAVNFSSFGEDEQAEILRLARESGFLGEPVINEGAGRMARSNRFESYIRQTDDLRKFLTDIGFYGEEAEAAIEDVVESSTGLFDPPSRSRTGTIREELDEIREAAPDATADLEALGEAIRNMQPPADNLLAHYFEEIRAAAAGALEAARALAAEGSGGTFTGPSRSRTGELRAAVATPIPQLARGGFIRSEGLAYVHAGELVGRPEQLRGGGSSVSVSFSPTVVIQGGGPGIEKAVEAALRKEGDTLVNRVLVPRLRRAMDRRSGGGF